MDLATTATLDFDMEAVKPTGKRTAEPQVDHQAGTVLHGVQAAPGVEAEVQPGRVAHQHHREAVVIGEKPARPHGRGWQGCHGEGHGSKDS